MHLDSRLGEFKAGPLLGLTFDEIRERFPEFAESWFGGTFVCPPGEEDEVAALSRIEAMLQELHELSLPWIAISHMGPLRAIDHLLGRQDLILVGNLSGMVLKESGWEPWEAPESTVRSLRRRVGLGCDTYGLPLCDAVSAWAKSREFELVTYGAVSGQDSPYPVVAFDVARAIAAGDLDAGILVCGTGLGMAIAANKVSGIRAVAVDNHYEARRAAGSNAAQVICLGAEIVGPQLASELLTEWCDTPFREGRSKEKLNLLAVLESEEKV